MTLNLSSITFSQLSRLGEASIQVRENTRSNEEGRLAENVSLTHTHTLFLSLTLSHTHTRAHLLGFGHVYTAFYFGISEVSTAVLCLLAPFDKVEGLGEAFPSLKIGLGTVFAVLFLLVRVLIWPLVSLSNARDSYRGIVFCRNGQYRPGRNVFWFAFFLISLSSLTVLQIIWLFVILDTLRTEVNLLLQ